MTGAIEDDPIGSPPHAARSAAGLGRLPASKALNDHGQLEFNWAKQRAPRLRKTRPRTEEPQTDFRPMPDGPVLNSPTLPAQKHFLRDSVERYLNERKIAYVNVDEAKKALFSGGRLSSFHFCVYASDGPNWLVWAARLSDKSRQDMAEWEKVFGPGFVAVVAKEKADGSLKFETLAGEKVEIA
jgi:hypothetical protein